MRYALLAIVLLVSIIAGSDASADCYDCWEGQDQEAYCDLQQGVNAGLWADCIGGKWCFTMPGGGTNCMPYCGSSRCFLI